ncbi:MAG: RNA polymerase sigma factor [bacterium]
MNKIPKHKLDDPNKAKLHEFEVNMQPFKDRLYRTALLLTKDSHEAEALVRVTCVQAWQNYHQFEVHNHFGAWLSHILLTNFVARVETTNASGRNSKFDQIW